MADNCHLPTKSIGPEVSFFSQAFNTIINPNKSIRFFMGKLFLKG